MISEEGGIQLSARFWRGMLGFLLLAGFIIGFRDEFGLIGNLVKSFFTTLSLRSVPLLIDQKTFSAIVVMILNGALFFTGYFVLLAWGSRFVLPALTPKDRGEVFKRLRAYNFPFTSWHGAAVFYKEGEPKAEKGELEESGQGVALLDLYSAIVLEQQQGDEDDQEETEDNPWHRLKLWFSCLLSALKEMLRTRLELEKKENNDSMVRAAGPGLVLIKGGEKIVGSADLRKQFRRSDRLQCNTGDGIEVSTNVTITFTLGESPEILHVAKFNEGWKIIKLEPVAPIREDPDATQTADWRVRVLLEELREEDCREIERFFRQGGFSWTSGNTGESKKETSDTLPFVFNEQRVISALYSRARDAKEGRLGDWTDLPLDVAVEICRNLLVHTPYDDFYKPNEPDDYPMKNYKAKFAQEVKNQGVLGYQIVRRADGHPFEGGQTFKHSGLLFSPAQSFASPADLRDRGIKVINAGFSDLEPSETVREKVFDAWRARWQQEADKIRAEYELQAKRIRSRERAKAQQDMIISISQILQSNQYTSEALVMRLYQALEAAATQPATQRLLPRDTIRMLWNLRQWLLPEEHPSGESVSGDFVEGEETEPEE
jgi:hypothetical protein